MRYLIITLIAIFAVALIAIAVTPSYKSEYELVTAPIRTPDHCQIGHIRPDELRARIEALKAQKIALESQFASMTNGEVKSAIQRWMRTALSNPTDAVSQIASIHARMRALGAHHIHDSMSTGTSMSAGSLDPAAARLTGTLTSYKMQYLLQLTWPEWLRPSADFLSITLSMPIQNATNSLLGIDVEVTRLRWDLFHFPGTWRIGALSARPCPDVSFFAS